MTTRSEDVLATVPELLIRAGEALRRAGEMMMKAGELRPHQVKKAAPVVLTAPVGAGKKAILSTLGKGQLAVLQRIVQHGSISRSELQALTGYRRSTLNRLIAELSAEGCVESSGGAVSVTDEGISRCGPIEKLPTGDKLREWWMDRLGLGQQTMLEAIASAYPKEIEREALDRITDYKSSTRNRLLAELSSMKLITTRNGMVRASDSLFG